MRSGRGLFQIDYRKLCEGVPGRKTAYPGITRCKPEIRENLYCGYRITLPFPLPDKRLMHGAEIISKRSLHLNDIRLAGRFSELDFEGHYFRNKYKKRATIPAPLLPRGVQWQQKQMTQRLWKAVLEQLIWGGHPKHIAQGYGLSHDMVKKISSKTVELFRGADEAETVKKLHLRGLSEDTAYLGRSFRMKENTFEMIFRLSKDSSQNTRIQCIDFYPEFGWGIDSHPYPPNKREIPAIRIRYMDFSYSASQYHWVPYILAYHVTRLRQVCVREQHRGKYRVPSGVWELLDECEQLLSAADMCHELDKVLSLIVQLLRRVPPIRLRARMVLRCLRKLQKETSAFFISEMIPADRCQIGNEELERIDAFLELLSAAAEKSDEPPEQILNRVVYLNEARIPLLIDYYKGELRYPFDPESGYRPMAKRPSGADIRCLAHLLRNGFLDADNFSPVPCSYQRYLAFHPDTPTAHRFRNLPSLNSSVFFDCGDCPWIDITGEKD